MEKLLSVVHLKKYFPLPKKNVFQRERSVLKANDDISLDIRAGETFGLVGESGCGKSTFGRTVLQLQPQTSGKVLYYGRDLRDFMPAYAKKLPEDAAEFTDGGIDLTKLKTRELRALRRDLQIIFQDPYSSLDPRMTVGQIIEEGVATHRYYKKGSKKMREYVLEIMRNCGLQEFMLHRYPHQFSGGQRQRICIARARRQAEIYCLR